MIKLFTKISFVRMLFVIVYFILPFQFTNLFAADFSVQKWIAVEIELTSSVSYSEPFYDVDVEAAFTGPDGLIITRPAFWDGDSTWKIRFAPTEIGTWTMTTTATDANNSGLHNISRTIECIPYSGDLDIYKFGFLKISDNGRYLTYDDGTPFFYLGDTHWILPHERFDTSNAPGVSSQFRYTVDKRVQQGFTVIQSEPIWQPHGGTHSGADEEEVASLWNGFGSDDLGGFRNLDRKFKYIADQGLVHANAQVDWARNPASLPDIYTEDYMARVARYWVARFGAYPVIWTIIDNNMYDAYDSETIKKWFAVGQSIFDSDDYDHPIMPHMEDGSNTTSANSWWADKPFHDGWAVQWQGDMTDKNISKGYWNYTPAKPAILYEGQYDQFWTDSRGALSEGYKAFQSGMYGFGYGANGVWNDIYSKPGDPPDYGTGYEMPDRYFWWYDGANLETGDQLTIFKDFYKSLEWWKLVPRFLDSEWALFYDGKHAYLASDERKNFVVLFANDSRSTGILKNLEPDSAYVASWFNPRDGEYTIIDTIVQSSTDWTIPARPTLGDWVLIVKKINLDLTGIEDSRIHNNLYQFELKQNYPNPFNPSTTISYSIPQSGLVTLKVFNIKGEIVAELVNKNQSVGNYSISFDASSLATGTYIYELTSNSMRVSKEMLLIK